MVLYTAIQFGIDQIFLSMLSGNFNLGSTWQTIKPRINMQSFMNIMVVGLQLKILAAIAKAVGGSQIGSFWKLKLRW